MKTIRTPCAIIRERTSTTPDKAIVLAVATLIRKSCIFAVLSGRRGIRHRRPHFHMEMPVSSSYRSVDFLPQKADKDGSIREAVVVGASNVPACVVVTAPTAKAEIRRHGQNGPQHRSG